MNEAFAPFQNEGHDKNQTNISVPGELVKGTFSSRPAKSRRSAAQLAKLQAQSQHFVNVPCPACDASRSSQSIEKDQFEYKLCDECRTWYLNPRPTAELLTEYFGDSENSRYWAKQIFPATDSASSWIRQQPGLDRILDLCERFAVRKRHLVQFHAGFGEFASLASSQGAFAHIRAIEPHPELAQACRSRGVNVLQKSLDDLGTDIQDVDVVVAFDLVARQFDPSLTFRCASQCLRDRGLLIGTCPNGECFEISALGARSDLIDPEHLNLFTSSSLTRLAMAHGFEMLEITTEGGGDVERVRELVQEQPGLLEGQPFLQRILADRDPQVGHQFQEFLNENRLSTPIWFAARRRSTSS